MTQTDNPTALDVAEYAVWYARKVKGPRHEVAARLLLEYPDMRVPSEEFRDALE